MREFKDDAGRQWPVRVNVNTIRSVRDATGFDLVTVISGEGIAQLSADPVLMVDVIYLVCKTTADRYGLGQEEFAEMLLGDVLGRAWAALLESLSDFPLDPRTRENFRYTLEISRKGADKAFDLIEQRKASGAIDRMIDAELQRMNLEIAGNDAPTEQPQPSFGGTSSSAPPSSA